MQRAAVFSNHCLRLLTMSLWLFLLYGCAPTGLVKPLKKGEFAASAHLGGPLIHFAGAPIPIPLSGLEGYYGLNNKVSVSAGLGLTSLAFGTGQISLGVLTDLLPETENRKIAVSGFAKAHLMLDRWEGNFRFYPETGFQAYKQFGKHRIYAGGSAWFETRFPEKKRVSNNFWIPMLHTGWQLDGAKWQPSFELKWIAPNQSSDNLVVDYIAPGSNGAIGIYLGILRKF